MIVDSQQQEPVYEHGDQIDHPLQINCNGAVIA